MVFIVGNSRSGTTMLLRMFNNHSLLYVCSELHFFEQLWSSNDKAKEIDKAEAIHLLSTLLYVYYNGYTGTTKPEECNAEAQDIYNLYYQQCKFAHQWFAQLLTHITHQNDKAIPCEKTPQNVFYIQDILELYPEAKIINLVRDPRAIMLSQKNKWKRRKMGATFITAKEAFRLRINYHPITMSKLWQSAIKAALQNAQYKEMISIKFEDVLQHPQQTLQKICNHIGINFEAKMLDIPLASSSNESDVAQFGIKKERADTWMNGGLSNTEIAICEAINKKYLEKFDYKFTNYKVNYFEAFFWLLIFPIKLGLAFFLNLNRMKSIGETIKKRLWAK